MGKTKIMLIKLSKGKNVMAGKLVLWNLDGDARLNYILYIFT